MKRRERLYFVKKKFKKWYKEFNFEPLVVNPNTFRWVSGTDELITTESPASGETVTVTIKAENIFDGKKVDWMNADEFGQWSTPK